MAVEEIDVIKHLLEVEKEATEMLLEAQKKADEKISESRSIADSRFHKEYADVVSRIEGEERSAKEKITENHANLIQAYKDELSALDKDSDSFNSLMDELLFA